MFWRTEPIDPNNGYYADDVGKITLEDPFSFSGTIAFLDGGTDGGMCFGYFNSKEKLSNITATEGAHPSNQSLVIGIDGPTRIGYYLSPGVTPVIGMSTGAQGPIFLPDGKKHRFTFEYDPKANNNIGHACMTVDGVKYEWDLTSQQREKGATFDRFGLMNARRGGKHIVVYFDDLTYTARRPKNYQPVFHKEEFTVVPYPENGRKY